MKALKPLLVVVLLTGIFIGCSSDITDPNPARTNDSEPGILSISRSWPSLGIIHDQCRLSMYTPAPVPAENIEISSPADPVINNKPAEKPFVFVKNTAQWYGFFWGDIYYSEGETQEPYKIFSSSFGGTSAAPDGDWIYFIRVDNAEIIGMDVVITSTPVRLEIESGLIEELDQSRNDPPWNYIVPAKNGEMYLYAAINIEGLQGDIRMVDNGNLVYSDYGSFLFPDLSDYGSTAIWTEYHDAWPAGEVHVYLFDIATKDKTIIHQVPSSIYRGPTDFEFWESEYTHVNEDGTKAAFTVVYFDKVNGGAYDNTPYQWDGSDSFTLPNETYRWCQGISISPGGQYVVWPSANFGDPSGINIVRSYFDGVTSDIASWISSNNIIDPWLNVCDNAVVLYGDHAGYMHYNPSYVKIFEGEPTTICDLNGACCFFAYKGNKASAM